MMESILKAQLSRKRLPQVLAGDEVKALIDNTKNLKHKAILLTIYSGGLRVSKASRPRVADIDSKRMLIQVNQGKGRKDRYIHLTTIGNTDNLKNCLYTILSNANLKYLRAYFKAYRPETWLFNGWIKEKPISTRTIQQVLQRILHKIQRTHFSPTIQGDKYTHHVQNC